MEIVQPDPAFLKPLLEKQPPLGSHTALRLKGTDQQKQNHDVKTNDMNLRKLKQNVEGFLVYLIYKSPNLFNLSCLHKILLSRSTK